PLLSSFRDSPGRPTRRLTNVPASPQIAWTLFGVGVLKTITSPRDGSETVRQIRHASTRSLESPRHPSPGFAQLRYGSIEDDGIRYGLTTQCLSPRTMRIAPAIVRIQSRKTRVLRESPGKSRLSGSCERRRAGTGGKCSGSYVVP